MTLSAEPLILGITVGLTYALLAVGLVLIYKSSRFINFAHGQLGVFSSMLVAKAVNDHGVNYWLAFVAALAVAVALAALVEVTVIRRLFNAPRVVLMVASIGVSQLLFAASFLDFIRPDPVTLVRKGYPTAFDVNVEVLGFVLRGPEFMILLFSPLAALGIAFLFRSTRVGLRVKAVAANDEAARLAGINVRRVSTSVWMIAGLLAAVTAILLGPARGGVNTEVLGPALMTRALTAGLVGKMVNLPAAFAAGIGLGVVEQLILFNFAGATAEVVIFALLMAVLLWRSAELAKQHRRAEAAVPFQERPRGVPDEVKGQPWLSPVRVTAGCAAVIVALLLPTFPGLQSQSQALLLVQATVMAIVGLSMYVLLSWTGQLSLGHFAFVGIGAFVAARLSAEGFSVPFVVLVAGIAGAAAAMIVGLPAARVSGVFLGVATLGFAVVSPGWLFKQDWFSGGRTHVELARLPIVGTVTSARGLYYVGLALLLITLAAVAIMQRRLSHRFVAVRDNARAASAHGLPTMAVNLTGFAISGFIAGAAGVLWGYANVNFELAAFHPSLSLTVLSMVVVGGVASSAGAVLGAIGVVGIPSLLHLSPTFVQATAGAALLLVLLQLPNGMITHYHLARDWLLRRIGKALASGTDFKRADVTGAKAGAALVCEDLTVVFGGLVALDRVSLRAERGEIVGLIGSNGSGKTTLIDCVSGFLKPDSGTIIVDGQHLSALGPEFRPYAGVGRSFQDARLYPGLTVAEALLVAQETTERPTFLSSLLRTPWQRESDRRASERVQETLRAFDLEPFADTPIRELPTGLRRVCSLASVSLLRPSLLLLDEPSAGLPQAKVIEFVPLIRDLRARLDCTILLIEHDMGLMAELCDRIYALEAGKVIAQGTPAEVANDPLVIASYLGENRSTISRSAVLPATSAPSNGSTRPTRRRRPQPLGAPAERASAGQ